MQPQVKSDFEFCLASWQVGAGLQSNWKDLKKEDNLKNEDSLQNEDNLRNVDDIKNEDNLNNEDDLKKKTLLLFVCFQLA